MKKKTGSIDDITPEEWNEMNRKHLEEQKSKVTYGEPLTFSDVMSTDTVSIKLSDIYPEYDDHSFNTPFNTPEFTISFPEPSIQYKFREDELIKELKDYIDSTYSQHYCQSGIQSSEVIVDRGRGIGFFLGNVDKYNARYGNKGSVDDHRKDLMKILHYALLALYVHDRENPKEYSVSVTD